MDQDNKKENYEIAFLAKDEANDAVKKLILKHKGEITKENPVQKLRLAYKIKNENFAFFGNLIFAMAPESAADLKTDLNLEAGLLRHFFRKARKRRAEESGTGGMAEGKPTGASFRERSRSFLGFRTDTKKPTEPVLTNEALEKKIEEILK